MTDITEHKWSDKDTRLADVYDDTKELALESTDRMVNFVYLDKSDAIAIAKHFGIIETSILHGKRNSHLLGTTDPFANTKELIKALNINRFGKT